VTITDLPYMAAEGNDTVASYRALHRNLLEDIGGRQVMSDLIVEVYEASTAWGVIPAGDIEVQMIESHADFFMRNQVALLAERRVLDLRTRWLLPRSLEVFGGRLGRLADRWDRWRSS
jgi:hypothetical protein